MNLIAKRRWFFIQLTSLCLIAWHMMGCNQVQSSHDQDTNSTLLLVQKNQIESEGKDFEEKGDFESAINKYNQAIEFDKKIYGSDKGRPMAFLASAYQKQGRFEEALATVRALLEFHSEQLNYQDWKEELEALVKYQGSGNPQLVKDYIAGYIQKHQAGLPPVASDIDAVLKMTRVLALYDTIGDQDSGIKYIDGILDYIYKEHPQLKRINTSVEAYSLSKIRNTPQDRRNRRPYEIVGEYLLIREAFEQDKKQGTKGRASQALIQSDYFPW